MLWDQAERVLDGVRFDVYAMELARRDGGSQRREVVVPADAVVVLPLLESTGPNAEPQVVLIRNERFAVGRTLLELPAGTLETGEDPAACAARELTEETGYVAAAVEPMMSFYTSPGFCTERMHAYRATKLHYQGQDLDETERIEIEPMRLSEALACVRDGRIEDAKTITTLLFYAQFGR